MRPWYLNSDGLGRRFENPTVWHKSNIKIEVKMDEKEGSKVNGRVGLNNEKREREMSRAEKESVLVGLL